MIDVLAEVSEAVRISVPVEHRRPIGVVGAGAIVDVAHLPAYTAAGLDVVAITDLDPDRAGAVAERHGIDTVYPMSRLCSPTTGSRWSTSPYRPSRSSGW